MNEILILINIILCILIIIYGNKYQKKGLYSTLSLFLILFLILTFKQTTFLKTSINYSIIVLPFIIVNIYLINDKYPKDKLISKHLPILTIYTIILLLLTTMFPSDPTSIYSSNINNLLQKYLINICVMPIMLIISITIITKLLKTIKKYNDIIITITITYLVSALPIIAGILISNIKIMPLGMLLYYCLSSYLFGIIIVPITATLILALKTKKKVTK